MTGFINWFSQIASITWFGLMSLPQRMGTAVATVVGIAGVVGVFVGVFSMATGFQHAMVASGSPTTAMVMRAGADSEMVSGFSHEETRLISDAPGIARNTNGALTSAEMYVIINRPKKNTGTDANVPLRGVDPASLSIRDQVKVVQGRLLEWGKNEIMVGAGAAREFSGLQIGDLVPVGTEKWTVVGIFTADGGVAESEMWCDCKLLQAAYNRGDTYQSVYAKLNSPGAFQEFKDSLSANPQLNVSVERQTDFLADQSSVMNTLIRTLGFAIAFLMALGAVFGALNTMYSAVSARTREIATLRALGFGNGAVVISLLLESLALALVGGVIGAGLAYVLLNGFHASTMNFQSFSQVAFAFRVTPALLLQGITWAVAIGLVGGLFPAIRAARLPIAAALREL